MIQLIVITGKRIVSTYDNRVIFRSDWEEYDLEKWISSTFQTRVLRIEKHGESSLHTAFVADVKSSRFLLISVAAASKLISPNEPNREEIVEYLSSIKSRLAVNLEYGIREGKVVRISEIPTDQRGLKCNCTCPGCGKNLVARLGEKKQKHFAHQGDACDIASAQQTALHMLAKEIIEEKKNCCFRGFHLIGISVSIEVLITK